jgi:hypothetical protein
MARATGLEPATSGVTGRHSNQLSYARAEKKRAEKKQLERAKGFEPSTPTLARLCSTPELHPHAPLFSLVSFLNWWSRTGSNRRPQHCQRCALPTELRPHFRRCGRGSNLRSDDQDRQSKADPARGTKNALLLASAGRPVKRLAGEGRSEGGARRLTISIWPIIHAKSRSRSIDRSRSIEKLVLWRGRVG